MLHRKGNGVDVEASMIETPPAGWWKRPLDGISRVQKVAAVEKYFRGSPDVFGV